MKLPRGRWYGRGYGAFGWSGGFGNLYPFCRWFPWLPRRWWAYPGYGLSYYGGRWLHPYYTSYYATPYMTPYRYAPY